MARKKNNTITIEDIQKIGWKKFLLLVIIAAAAYFFGVQEQQDNSGLIAGTISRVVDGDTAVIMVDGQERRVRFLGVDTPETVHPNKPVQFYGKEASNFTKSQLTGKRVWLEYDASPQDRYNRHLAYIWTAKPKTIDEAAIRRDMFNAKLLLGGYAKVMIIKPNKKYEVLFRQFEKEARNANKGLWSQ